MYISPNLAYKYYIIYLYFTQPCVVFVFTQPGVLFMCYSSLRIICILTQLAVLANAAVRPPGAAGAARSGKISVETVVKINEMLIFF